MIVVAPVDGQFAARQAQMGASSGQTGARARDQSGAGGGAAGQRRACAAFPNAQKNIVRRKNLGERDIDPLRKERVDFNRAPQRIEIDFGGVGYEKGGWTPPFSIARQGNQAAIDCLIRFMAEFSSCRMRSAETL